LKKTTLRENEDLSSYFERIVLRINEAIDLLAKKKIDLWNGGMNAIIGCVRDNELIITQTGKISGYLFRKDKISTITESHRVEIPSHPLKTFINVTSGQVIKSDRIFFANNDFFNCISLDRARSYLTKNSPTGAAAEIFKNFHGNNNSFDINAILIGISDLSTKDDEALPDIVYIDQKNETLKKFWCDKCQPFLNLLLKLVKKFSHKSAKTLIEGSKEINEKCQPIFSDFLKKAKAYPLINQKEKKPSTHFNEFLKKNKSIRINDFRATDQKPSSNANNFNKYLNSVLSIIMVIFRKKTRLYLYIVPIIILSIFIINNIKHKNQTRSSAKQEQELILTYDKANDLFEKAKQDKSLGKNDYLAEYTDALNLANTAKNSSTNKDKAIALIQDIRGLLDQEIKAYRLPNPDQNFTFGENITHMQIIGSIIYGINDDGKIYQFDTRDHQSNLVASISKDKGKIISVTKSESQNMLFLYTDQAVIFSYDINTKIPTVLTLADGQTTWEKANQIAAFSTNIYLLDTSNNMIWRHSLVDNVYSKGSKYFSKTTDLSNVVNFAIDGNIYLLQKSGSIQKYARGGLDQNFSITNILGTNKTIEDPTQIFASEDSNYLYIVDKKLNRIIQADKFGEFVGQYMLDDIIIDDLVINTKIKKYWVLSGSKIYEGNLQ